jgi:hypothetical protein
MGNRPSAPPPPPPQITQVIPTTASPTPVSPPPPPPIPVCDANCQRQKELTNLRTALDRATANKVSDPETYQKARVSYYTTLEGQGWLDKERTRIGEEEVGPLADQLNQKYKSLIDEKKSQSTFLGLLDVLKSEKEQNQEELKYIYDETAQNQTNRITIDRTNELGGETIIDPIGSYYPLMFQILLAILSVIILYLLYKRFVPSSPTPMAVGGKRVPH